MFFNKMIIEVEASGTQAKHGCVGTFTVPIVRGQRTRFRLVDVTVPDPPFMGPITAAIQTDIDSFNMPVVRNMAEVIAWFFSLRDSVTETRLFDCDFYGTEFDVKANLKAAGVHVALQDAFQLPHILPLGSYVGGSVDEKALDISQGYVVTTTFGGVEGFYRNQRSKRIGTFPRGTNKNASDYWFVTQNDHPTGTITVFSKRRSDGALLELPLPTGERWSARIEVVADSSALNPYQII